MLASEKLAIAAHLHVLLRRKVGRVTDTEWMASNAEYGMEIVRFTRAKSVEDGHPDLAVWADKLEQALLEPSKPQATPLMQRVMQLAREIPAASPPAPRPAPDYDSFAHSIFGESGMQDLNSDQRVSRRQRDPDAPRYVGGIR